MKRGVQMAFWFGLALFTVLLVVDGSRALWAALAGAGWGLALVAAYHLVPLVVDAAGLAVLLQKPGRLAGSALRARWLGESVNNLLPVAQMGGPLLMARLMAQDGVAPALAGAAVTVATTQQMLAQALFALIGIGLLLTHSGDAGLIWGLVGGATVFAGSAFLFLHLQRRGLFARLAGLLGRVAGGRAWLDLSGGAQALDAAVQTLYRRHRSRVVGSFVLNLLGWLLGAGEVWLAMQVLGHPVDWVDALFLESLGQAIRGMAFAVPGALGVQEGGYLLLGAMVGIPADLALALSLSKRARELAFGLPGLAVWQWREGRRLRRRGRIPVVIEPEG